MKKYSIYSLCFLLSLLLATDLFCSCQLAADDSAKNQLRNIFLLKAEVTDIGTAIPSANIFLKDKEYIFPKGLPKIIEGLEFTKIMKGSNGLKQLCSKGKGTIYIAFSDPNYNSEEWTNLKQNFVVNSETFHLYSYSYKKPETWVNIPQLQKPGTILFAENLELTDTNPPGVVICESNDPKLYFVTDPCIAILPNGKYIAGCRSKFDGKKATYRIFGSTDKGETWQKITDLDEVGFCSLFTHNGELYVMGTKGGFNHAIIRKSVDGGQTWTTPTDHKNGLLMGRSKSFHSASVPVVINNGRIWRAMEDNIPFGDRNFRAFLMSAPVNANLLDSSSWTCTVPLPYQKDWLGEERTFKGWFEGNAVVKPDGSMANFLRIEEQTYDGKAAMIHIAPDGVSASFDPKKDIIDFPGASKKFVIRYDSISSKYWSITNHTFDQDRGKEHCGLTRNRVVLVWSQDLRNWAISDTLISINDPHFHGYQYIDWLIDGNDIVAVSRTAHDYRKGLPVRQHDANYLTFHRFMNFRN